MQGAGLAAPGSAGRLPDRRTSEHHGARGEAPRPRAPRAEVAAATGSKAGPWRRYWGWRGSRGAETAPCPAWQGTGAGWAWQNQPWGHLSLKGSPGCGSQAGQQQGGAGGCRATPGSGMEVLAQQSTPPGRRRVTGAEGSGSSLAVLGPVPAPLSHPTPASSGDSHRTLQPEQAATAPA